MAPMHYHGPGIVDSAYEYTYIAISCGCSWACKLGSWTLNAGQNRMHPSAAEPMQLSPVQLGVSVRALHPTTPPSTGCNRAVRGYSTNEAHANKKHMTAPTNCPKATGGHYVLSFSSERT